MLAPMKGHQLLDDFSTSLPWLQYRVPIFSVGLNRRSRQRLKRESLRAELIVADLREFEIPARRLRQRRSAVGWAGTARR